MIASGSLMDTLQTLQDSSRRPLVVASADRADVLLGLAAVNMSGVGPHAAGVIATDGTKIGACQIACCLSQCVPPTACWRALCVHIPRIHC